MMSRRLCAVLAVVVVFTVLCPKVYGQQDSTAAIQQKIEQSVSGFVDRMMADTVEWLADFAKEKGLSSDSDQTTEQTAEPEAGVTASEAPEETAQIEEPIQDQNIVLQSEEEDALEIDQEPFRADEENGEKRESDAGDETEPLHEEALEADREEHERHSPLIIGATALLLAGIAVAVIALIRKKEKRQRAIQHTYQPVISADSDFITISFLSGEKRGCIDVLLRKDQYLIGSSSGCDLVLEGTDIDEKHACIYTRDGRQYIEDLDSEDGTYVDGMRLFSANRLRKNNIVTVGTISFRITF